MDEDAGGRKKMLSLTGGKQEVPVILDGEKVAIGFVGEVSLRGGIPLFGGT